MPKAQKGQKCCILCNELLLDTIALGDGWDFTSRGWLCPTCSPFVAALPRLHDRIKELIAVSENYIECNYLRTLEFMLSRVDRDGYCKTMTNLREYEDDYRVQLPWLHDLEV